MVWHGEFGSTLTHNRYWTHGEAMIPRLSFMAYKGFIRCSTANIISDDEQQAFQTSHDRVRLAMDAERAVKNAFIRGAYSAEYDKVEREAIVQARQDAFMKFIHKYDAISSPNLHLKIAALAFERSVSSISVENSTPKTRRILAQYDSARATAARVDFNDVASLAAYRAIEARFIDTANDVDITFDSYARFYGISIRPEPSTPSTQATYQPLGFLTAHAFNGRSIDFSASSFIYNGVYEYAAGTTPQNFLDSDLELAQEVLKYPSQFRSTPLNFCDVLNRALHVHFCGHTKLPTTILIAMGKADVCANPDCCLSGATFRCARCHAVRYHNRACRTAHHSIHVDFCSDNDCHGYAAPFYRANHAGLRATLLHLAAQFDDLSSELKGTAVTSTATALDTMFIPPLKRQSNPPHIGTYYVEPSP
jgi:hypothetical protein